MRAPKLVVGEVLVGYLTMFRVGECFVSDSVIRQSNGLVTVLDSSRWSRYRGDEYFPKDRRPTDLTQGQGIWEHRILSHIMGIREIANDVLYI